MRKTSAVLLAAFIIMSALFLTPVSAADDFPYARITASGNDPHGTFNFSPDGKNDSIDPDTVKWASIKYRTITETDSTGVQLIGQFYIVPAMEPFVPIRYEHTQQWEITVVDLTSVSEKTSLSSVWNSTKYTNTDSIRFDPLESNRDAEAQSSATDEARVQDGDCIDIAFIAFFDNEEDAKAYDGTQDTPYCMILPDDLEWFTGNKSIGMVEVIDNSAPATDPVTTEADATEPDTSAATATDPDTTAAPATDAATDATGTADVTTGESSVEKTESGKFPVWAIIIIAVAVVVLIAAILASVLGKKKKK